MKWIRPIAAVLVFALLVTGVVIWRQRVAAARAKAAEPKIELATVTRKDLVVTVAASGVIEALTTVEVKSRSGGEVKKLYVEAGDSVKAGQLIATVDPTDLRNRAQQASASVDSSKAQSVQARLQADLQVAQTTGDIRRAEAGLVSARAAVRQNEEQLRQEKESNVAALKQSQANLDAAKARLVQAESQAKAQPALSAADLSSAQASLESARQNLLRVKSGPRAQEIAQQEAAVRSADANLHNAKLSLERQQKLLEKGFAAQQSVDDAQRAYDQAVASRDQARQALALLREGSRPEDIAQAEAQVAQAEASLKVAQANQIQVDLRQKDVETARQAVVQAEASLASTQAQSRNIAVREKQLEAAKASLAQAETTLETARAGKLSDAVRKQQIRAATADLKRNTLVLDQALYDLNYTNVYAPRAGVIMTKLVEEGTVVPAGTAALKEGAGLVTIADTSQMYMLADVDESDMAGVKVGNACEVSASVLPNRKLPGHVVKIFPQGTEVQSVVRFPVRIKIDNPPAELRPGMTADVTIHVAERKDVLVVPDNTITRSGGRETVEVVVSEQQTEEREVEAGLSNWEETEVLSGLKEGEQVVIPPPPGTELPPWMGGGSAKKGTKAAQKEESERNRGRMLKSFQMRGR